VRGVIALVLAAIAVRPFPAYGDSELERGFRQMYGLDFDAARREIAAYQRAHPEDPLGVAAEAASYLFEEFHRQGVLTSEFFLDDDRLLGGVKGPSDPKRSAAFLAANQRARRMAEERLKKNSSDPDALFVLTLADGMEGDFLALIEKRQLASLSLIRRAEASGTRLLAVRPDALDAYVALGAANYIVGCLPSYKRFFLRLGGIRGDRSRGMEQLEQAARGGHYLKPLAQAFLALAARREGQNRRAVALLEQLTREFPRNGVFARELALARSAP